MKNFSWIREPPQVTFLPWAPWMRRRTIKGREFGLASVPPEIFLRSDNDRGNKERTKSELDHISLGRQLTYVKCTWLDCCQIFWPTKFRVILDHLVSWNQPRAKLARLSRKPSSNFACTETLDWNWAFRRAGATPRFLIPVGNQPENRSGPQMYLPFRRTVFPPALSTSLMSIEINHPN